MVADLQDPPEMIPDMIREWGNGRLRDRLRPGRGEQADVLDRRKRYYGLLSRWS